MDSPYNEIEDEAQTLDAQKKSSKERKNKFNERYKKLRRKEDKDVILCEVETDCTIQAHKALFIHTKNPVGFPGPSVTSLDFKDPLVNRTASEQDPDENETCISVKDIKDMNFATQLGVDCIAVSGVHSAEDIKEAKFILGPKTPVRLLSKIQDAKVNQL
jgi:Pyruvate kinase